MGCSQSTPVMEKPIPKENVAIKPKPQDSLNYLIGHISEHQYLFGKVNLALRTIDKLSIPLEFEPYNYSSMLEIENKQFIISGGINFSLTRITGECFIYQSGSHSVKKISNMNQARYTHAALLFEGQVYVFGGRYFGDDEEAILKSCEVYSFNQNQWTVLPNLNIQRCTCYAISWKNQIYVFGGYTGQFERSQKIQRLNFKTNSWEVKDYQLNRGIESGFVLSTDLNSITIFGGNTNSGATSSVSTINLNQRTIISHKPLKQKKMLHKSFVSGSQLYIFGGSQNGHLQIYDFVTNQSEVVDIKLNEQFAPEVFQVLTQSQKSIFIKHQNGKLQKTDFSSQDDIILMFGTREEPFIFELNVSIPSSTIYSVPLSLQLYSQAGGINIKGSQYILFGGIQDDSLSDVTASTYYYNHQKRESSKLPNMKIARYAFSYQRIGQKIYAIGGGNCDQQGNLLILQQCQYFDLKQNSWNHISSLPIPLISSMSLNYKQNLYVFGGISQHKKRNQTIYKYNSQKDMWDELKFQMPFGLEAASIYRYKQSQFYIFGGRGENGDSDGIWNLIFFDQGSVQCAFVQKGAMNEKKLCVKVFRPSYQNFIVCFGGISDLVSYYDVQTLKLMEWDGLRRLKQVILTQLDTLNSSSMKKYLTVSKNVQKQ